MTKFVTKEVAKVHVASNSVESMQHAKQAIMWPGVNASLATEAIIQTENAESVSIEACITFCMYN